MRLELLLTDKCLFIVLFALLFLLMRAQKREPVRLAFKEVFQSASAVAAAIVFLFFISIALLDSLHFKMDTKEQPLSVLDTILAPVGQVYEKTYSAPMALNLFSSEMQLRDGHSIQVYPRLSFPPDSIKSEVELRQTQVAACLKALALSLLMIAVSYLFWQLYFFSRYKKFHWKWNAAGISALITIFICAFLTIVAYAISRNLHFLGTGKIGQDIFYFAVKSIRTGIVIGSLTTLFMMPLALLLGIAAGYYGGLVDDLIQYIYTTLSSIPGVLLITASVLAMQTYIASHPEQFPSLGGRADARLLALCLILGVTSWTSLCRLLRAEVLKLREMDFVLAAKALGSNSMQIILKHLLPNVMHIVVITLVLDFSFLVLAEAVLSYVGVGVSPMTISWGNMINEARLELAREPVVWWPVMAAFIFMFILVLASNLFADAVRDAFDPRHETRN